MTLHIDSIDPPQGRAGQKWVTIRGDLDSATTVRWGDTKLSAEDWYEETYPDGHTELDITVPKGAGTVHVVAEGDGERSNDVEFTYE
ncbi:hypothetical protein [Streptomyces halobius]|uniref:IPT/TIG domain-containing protein n=1 Tax=Streptomyces halobius TaxID=2879846 RepID=A0ABY4M734_9ACTN|nr:hypothetical protein [Streptomyces halobius]UQA93576.1 hypothetical protein K9S39_18495 [Streptomyces halobius]